MAAIGSPFIECPHCDTAQRPEPISEKPLPLGGRIYLCPCCGKTFELPAAEKTPEKGRRLSI